MAIINEVDIKLNDFLNKYSTDTTYWEGGEKSLIHGDSIKLLKEIPNNSIDLVVTDPPYKTTSRGRGNEGTTTSGGMLKKDIVCKGKMFKENNVNIKDYAGELYRILKDESHCYIMTNNINLQEMLNVLTEVGFHFIKCLIWDKGNKIMSQAYMNQFEYILFLRKGKFKKINNCGTSDILSIQNKKSKDVNGNVIHVTEKPVELMKKLIENSSKEYDVILDPFMGVGAVPIACDELNRNFIGIELDEKYYEVSRERTFAVIDSQ